ncbi:hypothetical protein C8Q80DRAFT_1269906 [Daedaleopsis nitida]|nr:hypothetical protein C8Q80DRAFT_1269906 [Daedaleopsis nitida]
MDLRTLGIWRATCRAGNDHVARALRRTTTRMLFPFFPCTHEFLRHLTDHHAVIGGEVALSFVLRDSSFEPRVLEVYTGYGWFQPFIDNIALSSALATHLMWEREEDVGWPFVRHRGARKLAIFGTTSGRRVIVFESTTMSPCTPISRSWCTAMMNFVTEDCFAAAYLPLIEKRRALVSDLSCEPFHSDEDNTMDLLIQYGFSFSSHPTKWAKFNTPSSPPRATGENTYPCMRMRFACPDQGRYFGDRGSTVGLVDPLHRGFDFLHERLLPPFGHMPVWRLWNSTICDAGCAYGDSILPRGVISITALYSEEENSAVHQTRYDYEPEGHRDIATYVDVALAD